jgi:superkiller protein 3
LRSKITSQSLNWLYTYLSAVVRQEDASADYALSPSLKPRLARLEVAADGDYSGQIDRLYAEAPASAKPGLTDLAASSGGSILLGKSGSGKTRQLHDQTARLARTSLAQVEQLRLQSDATRNDFAPVFLPVFVQLPVIASLIADLERSGQRSNLFGAALETYLSQQAGAAVPPTLLSEVVPVILADNLEKLDLGQAPVFFSRFNQWFSTVTPEARVILACQHLSFVLYYPWFRPEQAWQFFGLYGFEWAEVRPFLGSRYSEAELDQLELTGLTGLFVHPSLCKLFTSNTSARSGLAGLLDIFTNNILGGNPALARQLAGYSQLLGDDFFATTTPVSGTSGVTTQSGVLPKGDTGAQPAGWWGSQFTRQAKPQATGQAQSDVLPKGIDLGQIPGLIAQGGNLIQGLASAVGTVSQAISALGIGQDNGGQSQDAKADSTSTPAPAATDNTPQNAATPTPQLTPDPSQQGLTNTTPTTLQAAPDAVAAPVLAPGNSTQSQILPAALIGAVAGAGAALAGTTGGATGASQQNNTQSSAQSSPVTAPTQTSYAAPAPVQTQAQPNYSNTTFAAPAITAPLPDSVAGLTETHPLADWTRLINPALDRLLAGWVCLQLDPATLPSALDRVVGFASQQGEGQLNFLKLLYLLTGPEARPALFNGLLGQPPTADRLQMLIAVVRVDPYSHETWQSYLTALAAGANQTFGRQVLDLVARIGKVDPDSAQPPNLELVSLAEIALELLSQTGPADAALYLQLGQNQEQLGLADKALNSYGKAHRSSSLPALEGTLGVARLRSQQGAYNEASSTLSNLKVRLNYFQAEIDNQLSVNFRQQGEFDAALDAARQAVERGKRPTYRHNLALALSAGGSRAEAEAELQKLTQEFPNFADGFYDLGRLQSERGAGDQALVNLGRAVELSSNTSRYLYDLGRSLLAQGKLDEALTHLKASVAQGTNQADYFVALGLVSLKLAQLDEANAAFTKSIELAGDKLRADQLAYLAATDFAQANYAEAQRSLTRALNLEPQKTILWMLSALVAEADNRSDLALAQYRKATTYSNDGSQAPANLRVAWELGMARGLRVNKRVDEAIRHSQTAGKLAAGTPATLYEEGQLALARNNKLDASTAFGRGVNALGMYVSKEEPATNLYPSETGWLQLFTVPGEVQFELPYAYAVTLRELARHEQAQKVLRQQLQNLEIVPARPRTELENALILSRRAAYNYELGLSLMALNNNQEGQLHLSQAVTGAPLKAVYRLGLAKALIKGGQVDRAVYELNQARELDAGLAEVNAVLAEINLAGGAKAPDQNVMLGSLNLYLKALESEPNNQRYLYRAALLAYHLRHQNHATELIRRLLQIAPNMPAAHLLLACNLERSGNLPKAREEIAIALAKGGKSADYYAVAARLARRANAQPEMEQLLTVLRVQPNLPLYLQAALKTEEGELALAQEKYFPAGEAYKEAIDAFQKFTATGQPIPLEELYYENGAFTGGSAYGQSLLANFKVAYAGVLQHLKNYDQALQELDEALAMQPSLASAHILRGDLLVQQGRMRDALGSRQRAAELEPSPQRLYDLGQTYLQLGEVEPAIDALKQVENSKEINNRSDYWAAFGQAYQKAKSYSAARAAYKRGLQLNPTDPELQKALADSFLSTGEKQSAVQYLQGAVVSQPQNPDLRMELARLYEDLTWNQEANSEYEQATNLNPSSPNVWLQRGKALNRTGQTEQARSSLEQALRLDGNLAEAHYEIGLLYLKSFQARSAQTDKLPPDLRGMFTSSGVAVGSRQ